MALRDFYVAKLSYRQLTETDYFSLTTSRRIISQMLKSTVDVISILLRHLEAFQAGQFPNNLSFFVYTRPANLSSASLVPISESGTVLQCDK